MGLFKSKAEKQTDRLFEQYKNLCEKPALPPSRPMHSYQDYESQCASILNSLGLEIDNDIMIEAQGGREFMCNVAKVQLAVRTNKVPVLALKAFDLDSQQFFKPMNVFISASGFEPDAIQYAYNADIILLQMTDDGRVGGVTRSGMLLLLIGTRAMLLGLNYGGDLQHRIFKHMYPNA